MNFIDAIISGGVPVAMRGIVESAVAAEWRKPVPWGSDIAWGSHLPPLMACLAASSGPVLEVGCGHWSTPVLSAYCRAAGRTFISAECAPEWAERFPEAIVLPGYDALRTYAASQWAVVFLDHSPGERRVADAMLFRDLAGYVVIHDWSSDEINETFPAVSDQWPHQRIYDRYMPSTMILSASRVIPEFR